MFNAFAVSNSILYVFKKARFKAFLWYYIIPFLDRFLCLGLQKNKNIKYLHLKLITAALLK